VSGIGFWELVVLFVIGLLILGPERLPRVATQIGRWVGRARRTANQLRFQLEREIALADIEKKSDHKREPDRSPKKPQAPAAGESATPEGESTRVDEPAPIDQSAEPARAASAANGADADEKSGG